MSSYGITKDSFIFEFKNFEYLRKELQMSVKRKIKKLINGFKDNLKKIGKALEQINCRNPNCREDPVITQPPPRGRRGGGNQPGHRSQPRSTSSRTGSRNTTFEDSPYQPRSFAHSQPSYFDPGLVDDFFRQFSQFEGHGQGDSSQGRQGRRVREGQKRQAELRKNFTKSFEEIISLSCSRFVLDSEKKKKFLDQDVSCCVICQEDFSFGVAKKDRLILLPCTHVFHDECVMKWLRMNYQKEEKMTCPLCRYCLPKTSSIELEKKRKIQMVCLFTEVGLTLMEMGFRVAHIFFLLEDSKKMKMREKVGLLKRSSGNLMEIMITLDGIDFGDERIMRKEKGMGMEENGEFSKKMEKNRQMRKKLIVRIQIIQEEIDSKLRNITVLH